MLKCEWINEVLEATLPPQTGMHLLKQEGRAMNESNERLMLNWFGPYSLSDLLLGNGEGREETIKEFCRPGVYLWTDFRDIEEGKQQEVISYVGKASGAPTLWQRQAEHYLHLIGGYYKLPKAWSPPGWKSNNGSWAANFGDPDVLDVLFDQSKYLGLVKKTFEYATQVRIHLCPYAAERVKDIERNLLYDLRPKDTTWGTQSEPTRRLWIEHHNANWATPVIRAHQIRDYVKFVSN